MRLGFVIANCHETRMRLEFENEWVPYKKRVVFVTLTDGQVKQLKCESVGKSGGTEIYEEILEVFIDSGSVDNQSHGVGVKCQETHDALKTILDNLGYTFPDEYREMAEKTLKKSGGE